MEPSSYAKALAEQRRRDRERERRVRDVKERAEKLGVRVVENKGKR